MTTETITKTLDDLLNASAATDAFKAAVRRLEAGEPQELIQAPRGNPPVKVLRFVMKLIESLDDVAVESVQVNGTSGCSNYTGSAVVQPGNINIDFDWDCAWRAETNGWQDAFGDPDQIRAARTFGYQCFRKFERS